jgi:hypothetical protein
MRSSKNQYTITAPEVHQRAGAMFQDHLKLTDHGRKCPCAVLLNILFFAASRITSVNAACRNLAKAPTEQTVFNALAATLPPYDELEKRLNNALIDRLPKALRKGSHYLAIDLTLIPYHGEPFRDPREIYRSQPKCGTSHFHAYATCYVVRHGQRFTLALTGVKYGEAMEIIVKRLLQRVRKIGVKCRVLLLDRGFYSVAVIRYLQAARCPFLMPVVHRGRKPKAGQPLTGTRAFARWKKSGWARHTMQSTKKNHWAKTATFDICVCCTNYAGQWKKHGRKTWVYAFWGFRPGSIRWVRETYRLRFGIESSYRQMNEARIRTCSRNPCVRLLFFGLAMILRNAWVWFHISLFARHVGRGVELHLEALRFEDLLLNLQRVAEAALGITQILQSQIAAKEQLTNAC